MKTNKKVDLNYDFTLREKYCKRGMSPESTAYLPINRPVACKIRIAELYAKYKIFPVSIRANEYFPELGLCIVFIPFTHTLLGRYNATTCTADKAFFQYWIQHRAPKHQEIIYHYPA